MQFPSFFVTLIALALVSETMAARPPAKKGKAPNKMHTMMGMKGKHTPGMRMGHKM